MAKKYYSDLTRDEVEQALNGGLQVPGMIITLEDLKKQKPSRSEFKTINNISVLHEGGGNIDTTPDTMTDADIKEIFNTLV